MKTIENRIDDLETRMDKIKDTLDFLKKFVEHGGKVEPVRQEQPKKPTLEEKYNSLTEVERNKIDNIMDNFNFQMVADAMKYFQWSWAGTKNGVPNIGEIEETAKRLLVDAAYEKTQIATGGLRVVYEKDEENPDDPFIQLEFILTDCEGFNEEDDDDDDDDDGDDSSDNWD